MNTNKYSRREGELPKGGETTSREAGITEIETVNNREETKEEKVNST